MTELKAGIKDTFSWDLCLVFQKSAVLRRVILMSNPFEAALLARSRPPTPWRTPRAAAAALTTFLSTSSSTSKLDVSEGLLTSGTYGASRLRMFSQFRPSKNACFLKSSMPFCPSRRSRLQISLWMRSFASSETSVTCDGNWNRSWGWAGAVAGF